MARISYQEYHLENILFDILRNHGSDISIKELAEQMDKRGVIAPKFKVYEKVTLASRSLASHSGISNKTVYIKNITKTPGSDALRYTVSEHADKTNPVGVFESRLFGPSEAVPEYNYFDHPEFEKYEDELCEKNKDKIAVILKRVYEASEIPDKELLKHVSVIGMSLLREGLLVSKFTPGQEVYIIDKFNPEENRSFCDGDNEKLAEYRIRTFCICKSIFGSRLCAPEHIICPVDITEKEKSEKLEFSWNKAFSEKEMFASFEEAEKILETIKGDKK